MSETIDRQLAEKSMEEHLDLEVDPEKTVATLMHEDGSVTVIEYGDYDDSVHSNPREFDGNVAHLVATRPTGWPHYIDLDEHDEGIKGARAQYEDYDSTETGVRNTYSSSKPLEELFWGRHALLQGRSKHNCEYMVRRYLSICRPDVVHYDHDWQVDGTSQSDWRGGYGYVLAEDAERESEKDGPRLTAWAKDAYEQELKVYGQWFAGEVYYARHFTIGKPIVIYGEHGAYVDSYEIDEDSCGGMLGYESNAAMAATFTDSPVVDET